MHSTSPVNCYSIFNNLTHGVIPMVKILENEDCGRGCRDAKRNSGLFITRDNAALKTKNKVLKRSWSRQAATLSPGKRHFTWLCFPVWQLKHCESYLHSLLYTLFIYSFDWYIENTADRLCCFLKMGIHF